MTHIQFGNGRGCCKKPVGCNLPFETCMYAKRRKAWQEGDPSVPCPAKAWPPDPNFTDGRTVCRPCLLPNGHDGEHDNGWTLADSEALYGKATS